MNKKSGLVINIKLLEINTRSFIKLKINNLESNIKY